MNIHLGSYFRAGAPRVLKHSQCDPPPFDRKSCTWSYLEFYPGETYMCRGVFNAQVLRDDYGWLISESLKYVSFRAMGTRSHLLTSLLRSSGDRYFNNDCHVMEMSSELQPLFLFIPWWNTFVDLFQFSLRTITGSNLCAGQRITWGFEGPVFRAIWYDVIWVYMAI
jgi:hypothetical protein